MAAPSDAAAPQHFRFVVIGGGVVAGYFARAMVQRAVARGELLIVSAEAEAPYERPALSKGFLTAGARLPGFLTCVGSGGAAQSAQWYADNGVELWLGARVAAVDRAARRVALADGRVVTYGDALVVATGASAVRLSCAGADLRGVFTLREYADALQLAAALAEAEQQKQQQQQQPDGAAAAEAVVVGGGYIGMEVGAALAGRGLRVTLVFPEPHLMARLFTPEIAAQYEAAYAERGVRFVKGPVVASLRGDADGHVRGVVLTDGRELPASLVVVGVGARANTALFGDLPSALGGLRVDRQLRAADGVFALGDVATFAPYAGSDELTRMEHVTNARLMAEHCARVLLSEPDAAYEYTPYFYSRIFQLAWKFYGRNVGAVTMIGQLPRLVCVWVDAGRAVGVFFEGVADADVARLKSALLHQPADAIAHLLGAASVDALLQA